MERAAQLVEALAPGLGAPHLRPTGAASVTVTLPSTQVRRRR
jgi:hypothetical protein